MSKITYQYEVTDVIEGTIDFNVDSDIPNVVQTIRLGNLPLSPAREYDLAYVGDVPFFMSALYDSFEEAADSIPTGMNEVELQYARRDIKPIITYDETFYGNKFRCVASYYVSTVNAGMQNPKIVYTNASVNIYVHSELAIMLTMRHNGIEVLDVDRFVDGFFEEFRGVVDSLMRNYWKDVKVIK